MFGRQISEDDDEEAKKERFFNDTLVNVDLLGYGPTTQKSSSQDSDDELLDLLQDLVIIFNQCHINVGSGGTLKLLKGAP